MTPYTSSVSNLVGLSLTSPASVWWQRRCYSEEGYEAKSEPLAGMFGTYTDTIRADLYLAANSDRARFGRSGGAGASHVHVLERHGLMLGVLAPTLVVFLFDFFRVRLHTGSY